MTDTILRDDREGIIVARLARADKKNAITAEMYRGLSAALAEASARPDIACVLIAAEGDAFCAGNDIKDFLAPGGADAALEFIEALGRFDKPIVAAVRGLAIGVGLTMLLHCDLVYAAPGTRFSVPFVSIGIVPEAASSLLLTARIGYAKAAEMFLLGQPIDAEAADRLGLVTAVVPADTLDAHALARAEALVAMPPQALKTTRRLIRGDVDAIVSRMKEEAELVGIALESAEAKEAFTAFLEKRKPDFRKAAAGAGAA
jgi:enoyl-CoA hydratase/carnithine racemase